MRKPRVRLDTLCMLVAMVALDLAWLRETVRHAFASPWVFGFSDRGFDASVLPMLTVLVVGLYHLIVHGGRSAFLIGFVIAGLVATLAFMLWIWTAPNSVSDTLTIRPFPGLVRAYRGNRISIEVFLLAGSIIDTSPQLLAALLGGWLARRMAARRRTTSSTASR